MNHRPLMYPRLDPSLPCAAMSRPRTHVAAALAACTLALAAPAAALAQSAGDEQYADPFGKVQKKGGSSQGSSGGQTQSAPAQTQPQAQAAQTQTQTTSSSELPRTGSPAGLLAATGAALMAGGSLLRRRVA
jgi:LPXTG-motif cell wall-anchored protein